MALQHREAKIETSIDNRRQRRHKLLLEVEARGSYAITGTVIVLDISDTGLLIETQAELGVGEMIEVNLPQAGLMEAEIVWAGGQIYGCRFSQNLTPAAISAARLGGRFTLAGTDKVPQLATTEKVGSDAGASIAATEGMSLCARLWVIIGLALSLWIIIGAAATWMIA